MRSLTLALLSLALVACGGEAGDGSSGVRGQVLAGPQCPVEQEGSPCPDLPFEGIVVASTSDGEVARTETDAEGRFELDLDPGTYTVVAESEPSQPPFGEPQDVTVPEGAFVNVTLTVDTGIR
jgi:Carboxypeptidase regulatory-like domain